MRVCVHLPVGLPTKVIVGDTRSFDPRGSEKACVMEIVKDLNESFHSMCLQTVNVHVSMWCIRVSAAWLMVNLALKG